MNPSELYSDGISLPTFTRWTVHPVPSQEQALHEKESEEHPLTCEVVSNSSAASIPSNGRVAHVLCMFDFLAYFDISSSLYQLVTNKS